MRVGSISARKEAPLATEKPLDSVIRVSAQKTTFAGLVTEKPDPAVIVWQASYRGLTRAEPSRTTSGSPRHPVTTWICWIAEPHPPSLHTSSRTDGAPGSEKVQIGFCSVLSTAAGSAV